MGIRTIITLKEANKLFENTKLFLKSLDKTIDGISDSTYIGTLNDGNKCILKIYEFASKEEVANEIKILNTLKGLPTPKPLINDTEVKNYKKKPVAIFTFLKGRSYDNPSIEQVKEIGLFLGKFHAFSQNIKSLNKNIYTQEEMTIFIKNIKNTKEFDENIKQKFLDKYELIKSLDLEENCVIHGDLFPDNAKFEKDKLTGVFDFVEACNGNFFFDLAVVINSWCFDEHKLNKDKFNEILLSYNKNSPIKINQNEIKQYMMYAALFYSCQRFNTKYIEKRDVAVKDYNEYLVKFNIIRFAILEYQKLRPNYNLYNINSTLFKQFWKSSVDKESFIDNWEGDPLKCWFNNSKFIVADVSFFSKNKIQFINGRHRTRWLLQQNLENIVIGLDDTGFKFAIQAGLNPVKYS